MDNVAKTAFPEPSAGVLLAGFTVLATEATVRAIQVTIVTVWTAVVATEPMICETVSMVFAGGLGGLARLIAVNVKINAVRETEIVGDEA